VVDVSTRDRDKWNARYADRGAPETPSTFLADCAELLPARGRALDVAAGGGRHGLWLARRGFDVTLADVAERGLAIAKERADAAGCPVRTLVHDFDDGVPAGPWDVIASLHFLNRSLFAGFASALAPGGLLLFAQPTVVNLERHEKPPRAFLLERAELPELIAELPLEVVRYTEEWTRDDRHEARLVARKG